MESDFEIVKRLNGHSGCALNLYKSDEHFFVKKQASSPEYNYRLKKQCVKQNLFAKYSKVQPSEIGFTIKYLEKMGENLNYTLKNSWEMYAKYFCVIDANSLGLYWPKYSNKVFRWRNFFGDNKQLEELTFKEWLNLYLSEINTDKYERIINGDES